MPSALEESVPETDWHVIPGCHGFESRRPLFFVNSPHLACPKPAKQ